MNILEDLDGVQYEIIKTTVFGGRKYIYYRFIGQKAQYSNRFENLKGWKINGREIE